MNSVTVERDRAASDLQERQSSHVKELETIVQSWKAKLDRLVQDTKERLKNLRAQLNEKTAELESTRQQLEQGKTALEDSIKERNLMREQAETQALSSNSVTAAAVQQSADEKRRLEEEKQALTVEKNTLHERLQKVEQELTNTRRTAQEYFRDLGVAKRKLEETETQVQQLSQATPTADQSSENPPPSSSTSQPDVEAIVAERLKDEREKLMNERATIEKRVADARVKFVEFQRKGIEAEKEKYEKMLSEKEQEHKAAIDKLLEEQASEIEKAKEVLSQEYQARIAALEQKIQQLEEKLAGAETTGSTTPNAAPATPGTQALPPNDELKKIVKRNVEHRIAKEREKWEKEAEATREQIVQARLAEEIEMTLKQREEEWGTKEAELISRNTKALESAKESAKQEAMMRSKVQVSMLEKKNKVLEDKVKALEAAAGPSAGSPVTATTRQSLSSPVPVQLQPQQLPPPPAQQQQLPPPPAQQQQLPPPPAQQQQLPPPPAQQQQQPPLQQQQARLGTQTQQHGPPSGIPAPLQRTLSQSPITPDPNGTIPQRLPQPTATPALRSLRGAIASNLPRGGLTAPTGRGAGQLPQPTQAGLQQQARTLGMTPHMQPPQQLQLSGGQQQQHQALIQQQLALAQHQQGASAGRGGSQLPRGGTTSGMRGSFGRGRGGAGMPHPQQQQPSLIQTGLPISGQPPVQSPGQGSKLSAAAKQFMPGKRQREEGEIDESPQGDHHPHQGGKRIRGGGQGGGPAPQA